MTHGRDQEKNIRAKGKSGPEDGAEATEGGVRPQADAETGLRSE